MKFSDWGNGGIHIYLEMHGKRTGDKLCACVVSVGLMARARTRTGIYLTVFAICNQQREASVPH